MENESSIKELINNSLDQVRSVVDADTIIGQPIRTENGTIIIPISKISIGLATGGLDLPTKNEGGIKNFGGGGGTGVSISPIGFLTVSPEGSVEMLPIAPVKSSPIEQVADIIDHAPDIIARIKSIFTDDKEEKAAAAAAAAAAAEAEAQAQLEAELKRQQEEEAAAAEAQRPLTKKEAKQLEKEAKKAAKEAKKAAKKNA